MRTRSAGLVAASMFLAILVPGCSLFDKMTHKKTTSTQASKVDLNSATRKQLDSLPGLTKDDAEKIVKNRPYSKKRDLVDRGVLDEKKFNAIRDEVEVSR
jgi:DNA uptake protein ComE-like DNA-binding protein